MQPDADGAVAALRRFRRAAALGSLVGFIPFVWVLTDGRLDFGRTAIRQGFFSNFFDIQAHALNRGHFWLPQGSLSIESFVVNGRTYMYFPPFPAIIRMPIAAITSRFDGHLTGPSMTVAWIVAAVCSAMALWRVRQMLRPGAPLSRLETVGVGIFMAVLGGGSVLVFLASLPWVYHEVYAWSIATSAWCIAAVLGVLLQPSRRRVVWVGLALTALVLTRTTMGWGAVAMTLLAALVLFLRRRSDPGAPRWWLGLVAGAAAAIGMACLVTWIKFGSPFRFLPLDAQVWTQLSAQRRRAMAANGGGLTNLAFLPTTLGAYWLPTGIRLRPYFPWITLPPTPPAIVGDVVFDQWYRVGSVTVFMPFLVGLSILGVAHVLVRFSRRDLPPVWVPVVGMAVGAGGVLAYGYMANRYTSDFVPLLLAASSIGFVAAFGRAQRWSKVGRVALVGVLAVAALWGALANLAVATTARATIGSSQALRDYVARQLDLGGVDGLVAVADELPTNSVADRLQVVGECDALLIGTGENEHPWVLVTAASFDAQVDTLVDRPQPTVEIGEFGRGGGRSSTLVLRLGGADRARLEVQGADTRATPWFDVPASGSFGLQVANDEHFEWWNITGPDGAAMRVPVSSFDVDWFEWVRPFTPVDSTGKDVSVAWTSATDPLCDRVLARAS